VVEGVSRSGDRGVDVRGSCSGNVADGLSGVWGDDRQALISGRLAPVSPDEKLVVATVVTGFRHVGTTFENATATSLLMLT
jgi:hypothetical protein